jgi:hypothetical protein
MDSRCFDKLRRRGRRGNARVVDPEVLLAGVAQVHSNVR